MEQIVGKVKGGTTGCGNVRILQSHCARWRTAWRRECCQNILQNKLFCKSAKTASEEIQQVRGTSKICNQLSGIEV
jgi:hypothetical protein